jgi:hypothetical protein
VRFRKFGSKPARSIGSRQAASTAPLVTPGRIALIAASNASMMTSDIRRTSSRTGAMTAPRMSGPKYRRRQPLSSSRIVSPGSSRRLPNVRCATPDRQPEVTIGSPAKKSEPAAIIAA